jgi:hypothetical protein
LKDRAPAIAFKKLPFESKEFVVMLVDSEKEEKERYKGLLSSHILFWAIFHE